MKFKETFLWGDAISANQSEGYRISDGRGLSVMDVTRTKKNKARVNEL